VQMIDLYASGVGRILDLGGRRIEAPKAPKGVNEVYTIVQKSSTSHENLVRFKLVTPEFQAKEVVHSYLIEHTTLTSTMRLSCTVFELLSIISRNLQTSRDHDHAHSRDSL